MRQSAQGWLILRQRLKSTMADSRKKVIVRLLGNTIHAGYLPLNSLLDTNSSALNLLDLQARVLPIRLEAVQHVAYVRDFNLADTVDPERLARRSFVARPRSEGLWVRITLHGAEPLEGLTPLDLTLFDALLQDRGIFLVPPDTRSNTQRLFVPRTAIQELRILAVITTPSRTNKPGTSPTQESQNRLFP